MYGSKDGDKLELIARQCLYKAGDYRHGACSYKHMDIKPSEVALAYFPKTYSKSTELRQKLREEDDNFKSIVSDADLLYIVRRLLGII